MIAMPTIVVTDPLFLTNGNALHIRSIGCLHDAKVISMACALLLGKHLWVLLIDDAVRNLRVMAVAIQTLTTEAVLEERLVRFVLHRVRLVLVRHVGGRAREGMRWVAVEDHGVVAVSVLAKHVLLLCLLLRTAIALILIARPLM